jgi:hypothetical protein
MMHKYSSIVNGLASLSSRKRGSGLCGEKVERASEVKPRILETSQTTMGDTIVESHPCAKNAQGWGTRPRFWLFYSRSYMSIRSSLEVPPAAGT